MKRKWLKILGIVVGALVLLVLAAFLYVNNGAFLQRHVLPRAATAVGAPISAGDADFSVFGYVTLTDLVIGEPDDPLVKAKTAHVDYALWPAVFSGGKDLQIGSVLLEDAVIDYRPDKMPRPPADAEEPEVEAEPSTGDVPTIRVENVQLKNVALRAELPTQDADGRTVGTQVIDITSTNVDIPLLANGEPFTVTLSADFETAMNGKSAGQVGVDGTINGRLDQNLKLVGSSGQITMLGKSGALLAQRGVRADWTIDGDPSQTMTIESLTVKQTFGDKDEARLSMSGVVRENGASAEMTIKAETLSPTPMVLLSQFAAPAYNFGLTMVDYEADLAYNGGDSPSLKAKGSLTVENFTLASAERELKALEPLTIKLTHDVRFMPPATPGEPGGQLTVNAFDLAVDTTAGRSLVTSSLSQPMAIDLANPTGDESASAELRINFIDMPVSLFSPLMAADGPQFSSGTVKGQATIGVVGTGKDLTVVSDVTVADLAMQTGDISVQGLTLRKEFDLRVQDMKTVTLTKAGQTLSTPQGEFLAVNVAGTLQLAEGEAAKTAIMDSGELTLDLDVTGANGRRLLSLFAPDLELRDAQVAYHATATITGNDIAIDGDLTGQRISLAVGETALPQNLGLKMTHQTGYNLADGRVSLPALNLNLRDSQATDIVAVSLGKPLTLQPGAHRMIDGEVDATVMVKDFPVEMLRPVLPPEVMLQLGGGLTNLELRAVSDESQRVVSITGKLRSTGFAPTYADQKLSPIQLVSEWDMTLEDQERLKIASLHARVHTDGAEPSRANLLGELSHSGWIRMRDGGFSGDVETAGAVYLGRVGPVLEPMIGDTTFNDSAFRVEARTVIEGSGVKNNGKMGFDKLTVASPSRNLKAGPPMSLETTWTIGYGIESRIVNFAALRMLLSNESATLMTIELAREMELPLPSEEEAMTPDGTPRPPRGTPLPIPPLNVSSKDLDLSQFAAFIPADSGITALAGKLDLTINLSEADGAAAAPAADGETPLPPIAMTMDAALKNLSISGPDGPTTTEPITARFALAATVDSSKMFTIKPPAGETVAVSTASRKLAGITFSGNLDAGFMGLPDADVRSYQPRPSRLSLRADTPLDLGAILALLPESAEEDDATPEPDEPDEPKTPLPPLDLSMDVAVKQLTYKKIVVANVAAQPTLRRNILDLQNATFQVDQNGRGQLSLRSDLANPEITDIALKTTITDVPAQPFVDTFLESWKIRLEGGLKTLAIDVKGRGADTDALKQSLAGTAEVTLDDLALKEIGGEYSELISNLIKMNYGIGLQDVFFETGRIAGTIGNGRFTITELNVRGPTLRVEGTGYYGFVSEEADYEITVQPSITQGSERQLPSWAADSLTKQPDGWYKAEPWKLSPKTLSTEGLTKQIAGGAVKGQLKKQLGGDVGDAAGKILDGDVEGGVGGAIKGLLGGDKKKETTAPKEGETPTQPAPEEPKKEDKKKDVIEGIRGLF